MKNSNPLPFLFALFFLHNQTIAQPGGNPDASLPGIVSGKILDAESKLPLEFATVTLFSTTDSALVTGGVADAKGAFSIEIGFGSYFAQVEFIAYKALTINPVTISKDKPAMNLGTISLSPEGEILEEIEVRAERSQMQLSLDKKIFNVGKDLANTGGSAADVLDNVPSVTVDVDGNVSLRGGGGVRILIDGRPSALAGASGTGLRNLPANMIDRVEIITNPSAKYEAEGMSGIINIVLKKNRQPGFNGSLDLGGGHPTYFGAAANANWRKNRLNLFGNYGLNYRSSPGKGKQYQEFYTDDTTFVTLQFSNRERSGWEKFHRLGFDYFFNPKNTLTAEFVFETSDEENSNDILYKDFLNRIGIVTGKTFRTDNETTQEPTLEYVLSYKKLFEEEDQELSIEFSYEGDEEDQRSDYEEHFYPQLGLGSDVHTLQRSKTEGGEGIYLLEADYSQPVGEEGSLEVGYRGSLSRVYNDYLVEEFQNDTWQSLPGLSNDFRYNENVQAAYATFGNEFGKFSVQPGLRFEWSDIETKLLQTNEINRQRYGKLFPSLHLSYELPKENALQISYSRRIRRPGDWELNPFFTFSDARNFWSGNPKLKPEFTNSFELGHIKYWEKATLTSAIFYRHSTGVIERLRTVDAEGNSFTRPENLAERDDYGFEFTWTFDLIEAWRLNGNLNLFRSQTSGEALGQSFETDDFTAFGRVSSRLTLFKKLDIQTTFNYRAPRKTPQGEEKAGYYADLGVSLDVLKNNGTLTLSVRDVFNTRRRRSVSRGEDFFTESNFKRARQATLTASYRLNQQKKREDEQGGEERNGGEF
ncbi:MAG: outer membrane beta-barrel family protein [Bacteroidota bacterium]